MKITEFLWSRCDEEANEIRTSQMKMRSDYEDDDEITKMKLNTMNKRYYDVNT